MSKQHFIKLVHYTIKTRVTIQWHLPYANHPQEKARNLEKNNRPKVKIMMKLLSSSIMTILLFSSLSGLSWFLIIKNQISFYNFLYNINIPNDKLIEELWALFSRNQGPPREKVSREKSWYFIDDAELLQYYLYWFSH